MQDITDLKHFIAKLLIYSIARYVSNTRHLFTGWDNSATLSKSDHFAAAQSRAAGYWRYLHCEKKNIFLSENFFNNEFATRKEILATSSST